MTTNTHSFRSRLAGSPCCLPKMPRKEIFNVYRKLGLRNLEAFSTWTESRYPWTSDPAADRTEAGGFGFAITSYHLPAIGSDIESGLQTALMAARYASHLGDGVVVLFKAEDRGIFAKTGRRFLDALEEEGLNVTPVLQNHKNSPITTLDDYRNVLDAIDDPRMQCVLEVGHFQRAGIAWKEGWDLLEGRIGLIHVNDIRDGESVRFGQGEVDFPGLMRRIKTSGYQGHIVVELELPDRGETPENTLEGLHEAIEHLSHCYEQP